MCTLKRLGLMVLVLVTAVLLVPPSIVAGKPGVYKPKAPGWNTTELINVGDEPQATGEVIWGKSIHEYDGPLGGVHSYQVTVQCRNLTPGATYLVLEQRPAWESSPLAFTANKKGDGKVTGRMIIDWDVWGWRGTVERLEADGSTTVVLAW